MTWWSEHMKHRINLTFFKTTGKYYSGADFEAEFPDGTPLFEVIDFVRNLRVKKDERTGLTSGGLSFYCVVNVPTHEHDHPSLLLPE